jgi:hypothetical protein
MEYASLDMHTLASLICILLRAGTGALIATISNNCELTRLEHLSKLHCYHHQWRHRKHQHRDVQRFHPYDIDHLKTPEPAHFISIHHWEVYKQKSSIYLAWV